MTEAALTQLEARLREDLDRLCFTGKDWVPPRLSGGERVRDVVIIGAGMCGLTASVALKKHGILNHVLYDMAPEGREGPWVTMARMETLRSPKILTGPAYGLPSLTFRAWFEAAHGVEAWAALDKIDRVHWMDYLIWYRKVMQVPVVNDARMLSVAAGPDGLIALTIAAEGQTQQVLTRKLVLATGRDGLGGNFLPPMALALPPHLRAHSADDIDFAALAGKKVGVVGAGASAMDNAATALEAGAAEMHLFVRRTDLPRINKGTGVGSPGMTHGYQALPDAWKWRIQTYLGQTQTPPPRGSTLRVSRHSNAYFHLGSPVTGLSEVEGRIALETPKGVYDLDFLIFSTGFAVDFAQRPELANIAPHIRLWRDGKVTGAEAEDGLAWSPDLGEHFEFKEKQRGACPMLKDILCFNFPAALSLGKVSGDIPAVSEGADRLARGITRSLFAADIEQHYQILENFASPELLGDEWTDADAPPSEQG